MTLEETAVLPFTVTLIVGSITLQALLFVASEAALYGTLIVKDVGDTLRTVAFLQPVTIEGSGSPHYSEINPMQNFH